MLEKNNFYLVGIKGVAMTSIAQCLIDAGKNVRGSDVGENFVTEDLLKKIQVTIDNITVVPDFANLSTDCVIYTSAHQGIDNPQVQAAIKLGIPVFSQAEALGEFFNDQRGIAVCGVGGKSTVSAMLSFVMDKIIGSKVSFSVGVGEIIGMPRTGRFNQDSEYFVAEADEYVIDCHAKEKDQASTPRFAFLNPFATICTNLKYDHPDVYADFEETKATFAKFFGQIKNDGLLIINGDNQDLVELTKNLDREDLKIISFGENENCDYKLADYDFELLVPGKFNLMNALATVTCLSELGFDQTAVMTALKEFKSTRRRFELVKQEGDIYHFDDYAHHPSEILSVIDTLNDKFGEQKKLIAFQPHTFSRTRQLFNDFVEALASHTKANDEILLIDIFPSAREADDPEMTSDKLVEAVLAKYPNCKIQNLKTIQALAEYVETHDHKVFITIGAGDIYRAQEL